MYKHAWYGDSVSGCDLQILVPGCVDGCMVSFQNESLTQTIGMSGRVIALGWSPSGFLKLWVKSAFLVPLLSWHALFYPPSTVTQMAEIIPSHSALQHMIYMGDPRSCILPSVLGIFFFLLTAHTKQICAWSLHTMWRFTHVHAWITVYRRCRWHTHLTKHSYFDYMINRKTFNLSHILR